MQGHRLHLLPRLSLLLLLPLLLNLASSMDESSTTPPRLLPAATGQAATQVDLSAGAAALTDQLGPLVINKDGTTSRITNWHTLTPAERTTTLKIITRRNRARLSALKQEL